MHRLSNSPFHINYRSEAHLSKQCEDFSETSADNDSEMPFNRHVLSAPRERDSLESARRKKKHEHFDFATNF